VLSARTILDREGLTIADVACSHRAGTGEPEQYTGTHALVFVRRGCFVRDAEGRRAVLDPSVAYGLNPGDEQRYDHPQGSGDDCTVLGVDEQLLGQLTGVGDGVPAGPFPTPPHIDLEHRLLLSGAQAGRDGHELVERAITLLSTGLEAQAPAVSDSQRRGGERRRHMLVAQAREALAADPGRSLSELARELAVSPYHLSRSFRIVTGHTVARHRMRLRVRVALERLAGGERDLARLAADTGFGDQSHLSRVIRGETGRTPGVLRSELSQGAYRPPCLT
jgi:AraC-like DNA-binding protein